MQYPLGGNNRLDGENRDRNNANRLFDSQNNNRGGYNVGNVYWIGDTIIPFKWTAQHSCGNDNNHCDMILQMMCDDRLRDGTTTKTIPDNPIECYNWDCDTDVRYGRHESFDYYQTCKKTQRNMGLFLASQNVKGTASIYTRQNPNGARRGYECPEERDYYPYWRPSPWVDVAVMTNNYPAACSEYRKLSQNVSPRYFCNITRDYLYMKNAITKSIPITQLDCENFKVTVPKKVVAKDESGNIMLDENKEKIWKTEMENGRPIMEERYAGRWVKMPRSTMEQRLIRAIGAPECLENQWSRDNHHGNIEGGYFAGYNWTVPDINADGCVFRLRYNISTADLPAMRDNLTTEDIGIKGEYHVGMQMGFNRSEIKENGYYFTNNPKVAPFYDYPTDDTDQPSFKMSDGEHLKFQLAVNTAQYGRTFEDRTHRFSIKKRTEAQKTEVIHNLGVRGKRGNIVQVYPATEYSFQPEVLEVAVGDKIAFQWQGSNTNPNNNAGQGKQGTDRSNIAPLASKVYEEDGMGTVTNGQWGRSYPGHLDSDSENHVPFLGMPKKAIERIASLVGISANGGELSELDDAGPWVDGGIWEITKAGIFNYLCTRNNNFSNRSQKGKIVAKPITQTVRSARVSYSGGMISQGGNELIVGEGAEGSPIVSFEVRGQADEGWCNPCASQYVGISELPATEGNTLKLTYESRFGWSPAVYFTTGGSVTESDNWDEVEETECEEGQCAVKVQASGIYVVDHYLSGGSVAAIVISCLLVFGVSGFLAFKRFK